MSDPIRLKQLQQYIKRVISLNFDSPISIQAEIIRINQSRGHMYLEVAEKDVDSDAIIAKARASIWRFNLQKIYQKHGAICDEILTEGAHISCQVELSYHELYGFNLSIIDIDPYFTLGNVYQHRAAILQRFEKEGLLLLNNQKELPTVLQRIAVISSSSAAGYHDFISSLSAHHSIHYTHHLFPAAMQGQAVEKEVSHQLTQLQHRAIDYDLIVIIRGGGGKVELSVFDNERIGRLIASSPIPVWSGIGHETDETIVDLVSHTACKTPTAVAEKIIRHNDSFIQFLHTTDQTLNQVVATTIAKEKKTLSYLKEKLAFTFQYKIEFEYRSLRFVQKQWDSAGTMIIQNEKRRLDDLKLALLYNDPAVILDKGYTLVEQNKKRISSLGEWTVGTPFTIHFHDGAKNIQSYEESE